MKKQPSFLPIHDLTPSREGVGSNVEDILNELHNMPLGHKFILNNISCACVGESGEDANAQYTLPVGQGKMICFQPGEHSDHEKIRGFMTKLGASCIRPSKIKRHSPVGILTGTNVPEQPPFSHFVEKFSAHNFFNLMQSVVGNPFLNSKESMPKPLRVNDDVSEDFYLIQALTTAFSFVVLAVFRGLFFSGVWLGLLDGMMLSVFSQTLSFVFHQNQWSLDSHGLSDIKTALFNQVVWLKSLIEQVPSEKDKSQSLQEDELIRDSSSWINWLNDLKESAIRNLLVFSSVSSLVSIVGLSLGLYSRASFPIIGAATPLLSRQFNRLPQCVVGFSQAIERTIGLEPKSSR
ncbi:MAG TPA: hypothetical protein QF353_02855 [Gammaproteobacteria bacterium]|nr:hypothetical protein [Gammaproteobacteria bacterium]